MPGHHINSISMILPWLIWALAFMTGSHALVSHSVRSRFWANHQSRGLPLTTSSSSHRWSMDLETPNSRESKLVRRWKLSSLFPIPRAHYDNNQRHLTDVPTEALHGMPWTDSIDPQHEKSPYYMPFWNHVMKVMKDNLTNLRVLPVISQETGNDLSYVENVDGKPPMRLHTLQFASDEFRLIRLTVMDAGARTQVFTSVWYPSPEYNTPILGIDLLQFGQRKHLCITDLQPVHDAQGLVQPCAYEHLLEPIRAKYPSVQNKMTDRFYDETSFFSENILLLREDDPQVAHEQISHEFFPAMEAYLNEYLSLHSTGSPWNNPGQTDAVLQRHIEYDVYSAERDPAHGLLKNCFGSDFADDYVYNVLFPFSKRPPTRDA